MQGAAVKATTSQDRFADIKLPECGFDDRQDRFLSTAHHQHRSGKALAETNTHRGFPASEVNIGWVQGTIGSLLDARRLLTMKDVDDFLQHSIQRLKKVAVFCVACKGPPKTVYFAIKTKDDNGWYAYQFSMYRLGGIQIEGMRAIPHNKDFGLFSFSYLDIEQMTH